MIYHQAFQDTRVKLENILTNAFFRNGLKVTDAIRSAIVTMQKGEPRLELNYMEISKLNYNQIFDLMEEVQKVSHYTIIKASKHLEQAAIKISPLNSDLERKLNEANLGLLKTAYMTEKEIKKDLSMKLSNMDHYWVWTQDWINCKYDILNMWKKIENRLGSH